MDTNVSLYLFEHESDVFIVVKDGHKIGEVWPSGSAGGRWAAYAVNPKNGRVRHSRLASFITINSAVDALVSAWTRPQGRTGTK